MLRRTVSSLVAAHRMDQSRHDVFVEGESDRILLEWLTRESRHRNVRILEVDKYVEIDGAPEGGAKGRLIALASQVLHNAPRAHFFADADYDTFLGKPVPNNVWTTDGKDLEGYLAEPTVMRKAVHLGLHCDSIDVATALTDIITFCRRIALLRILSERQHLALPFQRTSAARHVRKNQEQIQFMFDAYLRALLQNAGISLRRQSQIETVHEKVTEEFSATDDLRLIHGKDFLEVGEAYLRKRGLCARQLQSVLWAAFDDSIQARAPNLRKVIHFIESPV